MGRRRKENKVPTTTINVNEEILDRINSLKRVGETQNECMGRVLSQFTLVQELREERDAWESEAKQFKNKYYTKSNAYATLHNRIEELEEIVRTKEIQITTS